MTGGGVMSANLQNHGLFSGGFGGVVFEMGGSEKIVTMGLDFLEKIVHG